jgi:hypothetical protein
MASKVQLVLPTRLRINLQTPRGSVRELPILRILDLVAPDNRPARTKMSVQNRIPEVLLFSRTN